MKTVAVALAASLGLIVAGCALDRNVEGSAAVGDASQVHRNPGASPLVVANRGEAREAQEIEPDTAVVEGMPTAARVSTEDQPLPRPAATPAAPLPKKNQNGDEQGVRDAKEATEEAARKIYGAAVDAASRIREVGREAVQSVLDAGGREKDAADVGAQADEARSASGPDARGAEVSADGAGDSGAAQQ